jgi:hypothetical protein
VAPWLRGSVDREAPPRAPRSLPREWSSRTPHGPRGSRCQVPAPSFPPRASHRELPAASFPPRASCSVCLRSVPTQQRPRGANEAEHTGCVEVDRDVIAHGKPIRAVACDSQVVMPGKHAAVPQPTELRQQDRVTGAARCQVRRLRPHHPSGQTEWYQALPVHGVRCPPARRCRMASADRKMP